MPPDKSLTSICDLAFEVAAEISHTSLVDAFVNHPECSDGVNQSDQGACDRLLALNGNTGTFLLSDGKLRVVSSLRGKLPTGFSANNKREVKCPMGSIMEHLSKLDSSSKAFVFHVRNNQHDYGNNKAIIFLTDINYEYATNPKENCGAVSATAAETGAAALNAVVGDVEKPRRLLLESMLLPDEGRLTLEEAYSTSLASRILRLDRGASICFYFDPTENRVRLVDPNVARNNGLLASIPTGCEFYKSLFADSTQVISQLRFLANLFRRQGRDAVIQVINQSNLVNPRSDESIYTLTPLFHTKGPAINWVDVTIDDEPQGPSVREIVDPSPVDRRFDWSRYRVVKRIPISVLEGNKLQYHTVTHGNNDRTELVPLHDYGLYVIRICSDGETAEIIEASADLFRLQDAKLITMQCGHGHPGPLSEIANLQKYCPDREFVLIPKVNNYRPGYQVDLPCVQYEIGIVPKIDEDTTRPLVSEYLAGQEAIQEPLEVPAEPGLNSFSTDPAILSNALKSMKLGLKDAAFSDVHAQLISRDNAGKVLDGQAAVLSLRGESGFHLLNGKLNLPTEPTKFANITAADVEGCIQTMKVMGFQHFVIVPDSENRSLPTNKEWITYSIFPINDIYDFSSDIDTFFQNANLNPKLNPATPSAQEPRAKQPLLPNDNSSSFEDNGVDPTERFGMLELD